MSDGLLREPWPFFEHQLAMRHGRTFLGMLHRQTDLSRELCRHVISDLAADIGKIICQFFGTLRIGCGGIHQLLLEFRPTLRCSHVCACKLASGIGDTHLCGRRTRSLKSHDVRRVRPLMEIYAALCRDTYSRNASSMRVCQPAPVARK